MGLYLQLVSLPTDETPQLEHPLTRSIKSQRANKNAIMPDRADVTMTAPFMNAYVQLLIQTCHK